jgi:hypothetical protein
MMNVKGYETIKFYTCVTCTCFSSQPVKKYKTGGIVCILCSNCGHGLNKKVTVQKYWDTDPLLATLQFSDLMLLHR